MKSIWNNTFYNTQPALGWTFDISFDEYYQGDAEGNLGLSRLSQAAVEISIGKRESEFASVYYGGAEFKKFTRAQNNGTFTIKFNEDKFYTITGILENIYNTDNLNQNYFDAGSHPYNNPTIGSRIIKVNIYDPNQIELQQKNVFYIFYDCHIVSIEEAQLSYESEDTITRSASFVYNYMKFIDCRALRAAAIAQTEKMAELYQRYDLKQKRDNYRSKLDELANGNTFVNDQVYQNAVESLKIDELKMAGLEAERKARGSAGNGYRGH